MPDIVTSKTFVDGEKGITAAKMNQIIGGAVIQPAFYNSKPSSPTLDPTDVLLELKGTGAYAQITGAQIAGSVAGQLPLADTTQNGMLRQISGLTTDFVDGTNHCQNLAGSPAFGLARSRSYQALSNPNFEVDQRFCGSLSSNANGFVQDRWVNSRSGTMTFNSGQTAGQVLVPGTNFAISRSFHRIILTTAQASLAAGNVHQFYTVLDGPRFRELQYDVHSVQLLVRSSVAPLKFGLFLKDSPGTKTLTKLCTIPTANTWTLITLPNLPIFPPSGNFTTNLGVAGYLLGISLGCGSTGTSPANDVWGNGSWYAALGQDNWFASAVNSTFDIGFIQHEPGPVCTGFLDCPFYVNLADCEKYYQKAASLGNVACQGGFYHYLGPTLNANTIVRSGLRFSRRMARTPTIRVSGSTATLNQVYEENVGNVAVASVSATDAGITQVTLSANALAAGNSIMADWDADTGW